MVQKSNNRTYPLERSLFYRLKGKAKFERCVNIRWESIAKLLDTKHYRVWKNEKGREIQAPHGWLASIHKRIALLFSRIDLPSYVFSRKGVSYIDNARFHSENGGLIKTDICKYYKSISRKMVYNMFVDRFQCSLDIAGALADICCYNQQHLPTGSALSASIAFWAKQRMFEEIDKVARVNGGKMSLYVDDITISGCSAGSDVLVSVRNIIAKNGLRTTNKKSRIFRSDEVKLVTGVILVDGVLKLPNARHLKIHQARVAVMKTEGVQRSQALRVLRGREIEAEQVLGRRF